MNDANPDRKCNQCGAALADEAAEGLCVGCLLRQAALQTDSAFVPSCEEQEENTAKKEPVPLLEAVVAAFPHLEILELIGHGGMGAVYKARQPKLGRFVALKILSNRLAQDDRFTSRFLREGQLLARLNHPNIVTVHDFGQSTGSPGGGFYYLLMEYVDGVNLRQTMRAEKITPEQALAIVPKICDALAYAHGEGILHRDIKPENILLDTKGRVKIADFGLAKLKNEQEVGDAMQGAGDESQRNPRNFALTQTGQVLGTPSYMAPEQREHTGDVDHRADIYSLGVVFYELLTGELPLGRFAAPSEKAGVDADVDRIVLKALEKEREKRQQSAEELKTEIQQVTEKEIAVVPQTPESENWWTRLCDALEKFYSQPWHVRLFAIMLIGAIAIMMFIGPIGGLFVFPFGDASEALAHEYFLLPDDRKLPVALLGICVAILIFYRIRPRLRRRFRRLTASSLSENNVENDNEQDERWAVTKAFVICIAILALFLWLNNDFHGPPVIRLPEPKIMTLFIAILLVFRLLVFIFKPRKPKLSNMEPPTPETGSKCKSFWTSMVDEVKTWPIWAMILVGYAVIQVGLPFLGLVAFLIFTGICLIFNICFVGTPVHFVGMPGAMEMVLLMSGLPFLLILIFVIRMIIIRKRNRHDSDKE